MADEKKATLDNCDARDDRTSLNSRCPFVGARNPEAGYSECESCR